MKSQIVGTAIFTENCKPDELSPPTNMRFELNGDDVTLTIIQEKGRTYSTKAKINAKELRNIINHLVRGMNGHPTVD